ncbi:MAG: YihY/virulence factor BrkB family protein [Oscillochloridaceae bacterium umkhey_bin13]
MRNHPMVKMVQLTLNKYQRDNVGGLAAGIAYFTLFSLFPLLLVVISLVGFVIDPTRFDVEAQLLNLIGSPEVRELVAQTLSHFSETRVTSGLFGVGALLFTATGIFGALRRTFRLIWDSHPVQEDSGLKTTVITAVLGKLLAFGLLAGVAGLILLAVIGNLLISLMSAFTDWLPYNAIFTLVAQRLLTIGLITLALATLYKVLPDSLPTWSDVLPAALIAAISFAILQQVAELIFANINFSSFGVLGGAMTLLMWIYLSSQVILVGGELSYAWSHTLGSRRNQTPVLDPA